jgi:uncharacterized membrane protein required for colicin V production
MFNWFDIAVFLLLGVGLLRGRKHGMTKEALPVLQWLLLVLVCGMCYKSSAQALINTAAWDKSTSDVAGYLILAFLIWISFVVLKRILVPRLTGSNFFGGGEYYLGMFSGMIRFACILFFALALLNAPIYTPAEIQAHQAYVKRWFGGGIYGGNYVPTLPGVQESVFKKSWLGPYIKDYLGALLINTEPPAPGKPVAKTAVINIQR